ncbi:ParA family protein [bacterium]|nr:ParA family protein [bacterium]
MPQIICVSNQKGGVGKTTTAVNLAAALGSLGHFTLLVDMDPQANATSAVGLDPNNLEASTYDALVTDEPPRAQVVDGECKNLALLPASIDLAGAEIELLEREEREYALKRSLARLEDIYDYIVIDCPPSLSILTINSLVAADWVLIPVQAEYLALEGLSRMMLMIQKIQKRYQADLKLLGIVTTMFDGRTNLAQQVLEELKRAFPEKLLHTLISRSVRLSEAPSFGKPILYYDPRSTGSEQYLDLTREIIHVCDEETRARTGA